MSYSRVWCHYLSLVALMWSLYCYFNKPLNQTHWYKFFSFYKVVHFFSSLNITKIYYKPDNYLSYRGFITLSKGVKMFTGKAPFVNTPFFVIIPWLAKKTCQLICELVFCLFICLFYANGCCSIETGSQWQVWLHFKLKGVILQFVLCLDKLSICQILFLGWGCSYF